MPELPEVETVRAGLSALLVGQRVDQIQIYQPQLRYPVSAALTHCLAGCDVRGFERRAKYLLLRFATGTVLIHLGMSGNLRWIDPGHDLTPPQKHDHVDFVFRNGGCLRYHDPRRFGLILWHPGSEPQQHRLLAQLGVEPLSEQLTAEYLMTKSRHRHLPIKSFIMDNHVIVGVGNIYANEVLFKVGIHPQRPANSLTIEDCARLIETIRAVLLAAIQAGGTTLQDFVNGHGAPGYFQQQLFVYARQGQPCLCCGTTILSLRIGQRSSFFCPGCQPR